VLKSPDGRLGLDLELKDGVLRYALSRDGQPFVLSSDTGLKWGQAPVQWEQFTVSTDSHSSSWKPVWGKRGEIENEYAEALVHLTTEGEDLVPMAVVFRLYDEGMAFRYQLGKTVGATDKLTIDADLSEFRFAADGTAWSYNGEHENKGPEPLSGINGKRRLPMTVRFGGSTYATVTEAVIDNFAWLDLSATDGKLAFQASLEKSTVALPFDTPWRVILVGNNPGDLVDASVLENLSPPCAIEDPSWVKPGVTFWDWRTWGYEAPDGFSYGLDMKSWQRFIDYAGKTGVPYLLLDANWYGPEFDPKEDPTTSRDHMVEQNAQGRVIRKPAPADWADPIDIPALIKYGKERNVGVFLYINDKARINFDFEKTLATYRDWGAAGIKYGFMGAKTRQQKVNKTNEIIRLCAKYKLMCNFHDGPMPPNGDYRTWPNCTTREYCHAQADAKRSFTPTTFNTTVWVNMVTGPIDMNNGMFALDHGHENRPKVFKPIPSTIVGECARTLITFSGQTIVADAPEYYAKHPELFAFIAAQKQPWLESETLNGRIGEFIVMRRTAADGAILLGATTNEEAREIEVPLAFLGAGAWKATILQDAADTHFQKQCETYTIKKRDVVAKDTLTLKLAPGGGACVKFSR
jgi:alpha-glucosidase